MLAIFRFLQLSVLLAQPERNSLTLLNPVNQSRCSADSTPWCSPSRVLWLEAAEETDYLGASRHHVGSTFSRDEMHSEL